MKVNVLGVRFDNVTPEEALERGAQLMEQSGFHYVVTPNPEFVLDRKSTRLNSSHAT